MNYQQEKSTLCYIEMLVVCHRISSYPSTSSKFLLSISR